VDTKRIQPDSTLLSPREAAKLLNVPIPRVLYMIHHKKLPAFKVGSQWRIFRSDVIKLVARYQ
jgi:excisionase family DNA binding protein